MSVTLDLTSNIAPVAARFSALTRKIEEQATVRSLNRAIVTARATAAREIAKEYPGIKIAKTKEAMKTINATRGKPEAMLRVQGARLPLIDFVAGRVSLSGVNFVRRRGKLRVSSVAKQTEGIRVRIKGQIKLIPHAFIAMTKSGHIGVFVRAYSSKSTSDMKFRFGKDSRIKPWPSHDLPIAELTTLNIPRAFMNEKVQGVIKPVARDAFLKNLQAELAYRTGS
jgi:hypothetical protein